MIKVTQEMIDSHHIHGSKPYRCPIEQALICRWLRVSTW